MFNIVLTLVILLWISLAVSATYFIVKAIKLKNSHSPIDYNNYERVLLKGVILLVAFILTFVLLIIVVV